MWYACSVACASLFKSICKSNTPMLIKECKQTFKKFTVNSECEYASRVGENILRQGGNSADAAVAATLAIGVANSFSAGIGGSGFMVVKQGEKVELIDFRDVVPKNATEEYYIKNPAHMTKTLKSALVPGELKGLYTLHQKYGSLPWEKLFEEPIKMCEEGFKANLILILKLKKNEQAVFADPGFREIYTRDDKLISKNDTIYRKNLGKTLRTIAANPDSFYTGEIAEKIDKFSKEQGGFITKEDLKDYKVEIRKVYKTKFKEFNVYTTSLPTSGPFVAMALNILSYFDLTEFYHKLTVNNEFYIFHFLVEIYKFMFMHRSEVEDPMMMAEPEKYERMLRSKDFALNLFKRITFDKAIERADVSGKPFKEDHGTTHMNILDSDGNAVLITTTVNLEFGSVVMDPETGIIFNNTIDDFALPSMPNYYELPGSDKNRIEPGKRPFSSIAPTILESDDELVLLGAAGGTKIPTSIVSTILFFYLTRNLNKSIALPRIHDQLIPATTYVEGTFPYILTEQLRALGHKIEVAENIGTFTSVNGVYAKKTENGLVIEPSADLRKMGHSCGK